MFVSFIFLTRFQEDMCASTSREGKKRSVVAKEPKAPLILPAKDELCAGWCPPSASLSSMSSLLPGLQQVLCLHLFIFI